MERLEKADFSFHAGKWPPDKDRQTLVLIHGAGATSLSWIFQIKELADHVNVIVPDLPGHGKSKGKGMDNIPDYTKRIADFLSALDIGKYIIAGVSMGGAIAQQFLLDYPGRLNGGILINTGAKLKVLPSIIEAVKMDFKAFIIGMTDILFPADSGIKNFDTIKDMLEIKQSVVLNDFYACDKFDLRGRLREINLPVLIISSKSDIMTPVGYGEYLFTHIKNSKFVIIEGAGHISPFEKPVEVNAAILEFIKSIGG